MRGFSLVEITVGVFITLLLLLSTYSIFILSQQAKKRFENRAEVVQNERSILDRMARELRQANNIVTTLPSSEILFEDGHSNLEGGSIQYLRYHLSGTDLYREVRYYYFAPDTETHVYHSDTGGEGHSPSVQVIEDHLVGEFVSSLSFSGSGTITISVTFLRNGQTLTLTSDVASRNAN
ncbi:MAG: hypothetical protein HY974_01165 [Candidatus Kerfeldbacteria bacterium]|nr:hypothetical protein [Candidatus Kerfeldbacteria bacterium]